MDSLTMNRTGRGQTDWSITASSPVKLLGKSRNPVSGRLSSPKIFALPIESLRNHPYNRRTNRWHFLPIGILSRSLTANNSNVSHSRPRRRGNPSHATGKIYRSVPATKSSPLPNRNPSLVQRAPGALSRCRSESRSEQ